MYVETIQSQEVFFNPNLVVHYKMNSQDSICIANMNHPIYKTVFYSEGVINCYGLTAQ